MNFDLTDERQMLQDGLRRYLRETVTADLLASASQSATGQSDRLWSGLAEMGVIGALFSEEQGGFGGAGFDIALVFEELGRAGTFEPLLEMGVLSGGLLAALGRDDLIGQIIAGDARVAFAHAEPGGRYDPCHVTTTATASDTGWTLQGRKALVAALPFATHVLLSARTGGAVRDTSGISLFLLPVDKVQARDYPLNGGGRAAELDLNGTEVPQDALVGPEGGAWEALERANARAVAAISAEALGLMESIRTLTTDYLQTRKQFGKPIGKFQALQHRMADVLIEIEQARSAVINLAGHLDADRVTRERHVSATKNLIGRAGRLVVEESIQMHGGIGMTEEYALAHLAKRLTMVDHRLGDADYHLERFIRLSAA
ncbi:acyl-CoA dehydrogenase family protein [Puniceibacterium confluentis]|uniref:acyl-CoA dehydrogenase family protein n=1 Tax=Puniceibacterium confluentis TaxID=1958944 RepID=UPI0011B7F260|nr:acyl-CoA dehydrogenase [Puniceibacterium confluentis]